MRIWLCVAVENSIESGNQSIPAIATEIGPKLWVGTGSPESSDGIPVDARETDSQRPGANTVHVACAGKTMQACGCFEGFDKVINPIGLL